MLYYILSECRQIVFRFVFNAARGVNQAITRNHILSFVPFNERSLRTSIINEEILKYRIAKDIHSFGKLLVGFRSTPQQNAPYRLQE